MDREVELREFVSARGAALSRAAFLLTGDHQAAEDLVQDTHVVLVKRWQLPWNSPPEPVAGVDEAGVTADRLTLQQALARLTPRQRAVLVLRFFEDLTEVQAAAALGVSANTVKSQTRVALQRLRELAPDTVASFEGVES